MRGHNIEKSAPAATASIAATISPPEALLAFAFFAGAAVVSAGRGGICKQTVLIQPALSQPEIISCSGKNTGSCPQLLWHDLAFTEAPLSLQLAGGA